MIAQHRQVDEDHAEGKPLRAHRIRFMATKVWAEVVNVNAHNRIIGVIRFLFQWGRSLLILGIVLPF
jgi:hypothetical protein